MRNDNNKSAREYVKREILKRLVSPIDGRAYQWIIDQVANYKKPVYKNNDYAQEVLKILNQLVVTVKLPGEYEDKDYLLIYRHGL